MKDKSWIIILIMGIALTISIVYSVVVSNKKREPGTSTVTTTSIIEMTASTVTIKNTLTGTGKIEYKEKVQKTAEENTINEAKTNSVDVSDETNTTSETNEEHIKTYQILLSIEDKDLQKAKLDQDVEVVVKENEEVLNYVGKVIKINKDINNKSTIDIEIINPNDMLKEEQIATCTVIIEKAENVVAIPIDAIQKDEENKEYVDVVGQDGTTQPVYIKTGISDDYYVEITSGLKVGERVQIVKSSTTVVNEKTN